MAKLSLQKINHFRNPKLLLSFSLISVLLASYIGMYQYFGSKNKQLESTLSGIERESRELAASSSAELQRLVAKIKDLEAELTSKNEAISSLNSNLRQLGESGSALEGELKEGQAKLEEQLSKNQKELERQQACNKANELSQIPADMVFRSTGCDVAYRYDRIPSSTQGVFEYVRGFLDNYRKTGSSYWQHNPDICVEDAQKYLPVLENRYEEYQKYKGACEET